MDVAVGTVGGLWTFLTHHDAQKEFDNYLS